MRSLTEVRSAITENKSVITSVRPRKACGKNGGHSLWGGPHLLRMTKITTQLAWLSQCAGSSSLRHQIVDLITLGDEVKLERDRLVPLSLLQQSLSHSLRRRIARKLFQPHGFPMKLTPFGHYDVSLP